MKPILVILAAALVLYGQNEQAGAPSQPPPPSQPAQAEQSPGNVNRSWLGSLEPMLHRIQADRGFPMDFEHRGKMPIETWRKRGRAEVQTTLSYFPAQVPLDLKVESVTKRDGYEIRMISFAGSAYYRIPAYLLVPDGAGRHPGVVALHDHGGWFFHGKEKLVRLDGESPALQTFRDKYYGGRSYADELARKGFVVRATEDCSTNTLQWS